MTRTVQLHDRAYQQESDTRTPERLHTSAPDVPQLKAEKGWNSRCLWGLELLSTARCMSFSLG